ncbi:hypothetical protein BH09ACT10_BH09ACT10_17190 [soil metagenome]
MGVCHDGRVPRPPENETPLVGGQVGGAVRVGDTVRRPTGPWTPAVHALLKHLNGVGLDKVPRVLGIDERDREILTFIPGRGVDVNGEVVRRDVLADAAGWLRRFHDAVDGFETDLPWRTSGEGSLICHNDPGAYNWIIDGGRFAGMIDWDMAGPGDPLDDIAFMAWTSVPLYREIPVDEVAHRLDDMADAYGEWGPLTLLDAVERRMEKAIARITAGQAAGDPGLVHLGTLGEPGRTRGRLDALP